MRQRPPPFNPVMLSTYPEYRAGPKTTILAGGDAEDRHNNQCNNVREQVRWAAVQDPWVDPAIKPPRSVLYQQHIKLVESERQSFIDYFDLSPYLATRNPDGEFVNRGTRLRWEGWLAATLGFKRADYRVQLCSKHKNEMPCDECQEEHEQMRRDDQRNYENRG